MKEISSKELKELEGDKRSYRRLLPASQMIFKTIGL